MIIPDKEEQLIRSKINVTQILQSIIIAGIIGLFIQFQDLKDATILSVTEREAIKEDVKELKFEIRNLRNALYQTGRTYRDSNYGETEKGS